MKQMKQIPLILSSRFMKNHIRAGEPTYFKEKIELAFNKDRDNIMPDGTIITPKIHTIRADYDGWVKKIEEVNSGNAILRVVEWEDVPYRSKWVDIVNLTKDDGIRVQKLQLGKDIEYELGGDMKYGLIESNYELVELCYYSQSLIPLDIIAKNDSLSLSDFKDWFKDYDLTKPLAIIHFTKSRY